MITARSSRKTAGVFLKTRCNLYPVTCNKRPIWFKKLVLLFVTCSMIHATGVSQKRDEILFIPYTAIADS